MVEPRTPAAVLAAFLLGLMLPTTMAAAGDGVVGTATLDLQDEATGRKVTSELWYRTAPDAKVEWFSPRAPLRAIPIAILVPLVCWYVLDKLLLIQLPAGTLFGNG